MRYIGPKNIFSILMIVKTAESSVAGDEKT